MATTKTVVVYQENNAPIELIDEDERSLEDYSKSLSKFMTLNNISILKTSHDSIVIRPSKISSIHVNVTEFLSKPEGVGPAPIPKKKAAKTKLKKPVVDIITDVDD